MEIEKLNGLIKDIEAEYFASLSTGCAAQQQFNRSDATGQKKLKPNAITTVNR
jgi:hypothetical protein